MSDFGDLTLEDLAQSAFPTATMLAGFGVVVAWSGLALAGFWKMEPGWVDRLGVFLGICWILLSVPSAFYLSC